MINYQRRIETNVLSLNGYLFAMLGKLSIDPNGGRQDCLKERFWSHDYLSWNELTNEKWGFIYTWPAYVTSQGLLQFGGCNQLLPSSSFSFYTTSIFL